MDLQQPTTPPVNGQNQPQAPVSTPAHRWGMLAIIAISAILLGTLGYFLINNKYNTSVVVPTYTPRVQNTSYKNTQYGFEIPLPASWTGYTVLNQQWDGQDIATGKVTEHGPKIVLRHPLWTSANPREDMPILVFTPAQWNLVTQEKISLGAAPIAPSKLAQNANYIFALPARYNYDFKTGYEEVDQLVHQLKAI